MLRTIPVSQLEVGMFIHSFEGSWFDNPFWRSRFLLTDHKQLERIVESGVEQVIINESRGTGLPTVSQTDVAPQPLEASERAPKRVAVSQPPPAPGPRSYLRETPKPSFGRLSTRQRAAQAQKASRIINQSRAAVMNLFQDARLGNAVKGDEMAPLVSQISESVSIDPTIILNMARLKSEDEHSYLHSVAVCALMITLARKMGVPEAQIQEVGMAGLLHDVGKSSIPDSTGSDPGAREKAESAAVQNHPQRGHDILSSSKGVGDIALEVCLRHHEKMDGTGFPGGIRADNFSIFSRMCAICDDYDDLTASRPDRDALSASAALARMQAASGHYDKLILREFVDSLGILPVGSLVRLDRNELAVVLGESPSDYSAPIVRTFKSLDDNRRFESKDIDLGRTRSRKLVGLEDPADLGFYDWKMYSVQLMSKPFAA